MPRYRCPATVLTVSCARAMATAQRRAVCVGSRDHAAIRYSAGETNNAAAALNRRLESGNAKLTFDPANGYLRRRLEALGVPVERQARGFSKTSFQASPTIFRTPRAFSFNNIAPLGW